jgi:beta-galactosidase
MIATSSGDESGSFPPTNDVDGNFNTHWSSAFEDNEWFQVDLGSLQPIGQVLIRWQSAFGTSYLIQTSTDGQTWVTAFQQKNGQGRIDNLTFPTVNARYVRMQGQTRSSQYGYSFWEFEVYGPLAPTIVTEPVNQTVARGATAQFTVVAGGTGPFNYQWLLNGANIPCATSAPYTTPALSVADSGSLFSVVVSNGAASTPSSNALLTVNPPPQNAAAGIANLALGKPATSSGTRTADLAHLMPWTVISPVAGRQPLLTTSGSRWISALK